MMRDAVRHGLTKLTVASEREGRRQFWIYAGCVAGPALLLWSVVGPAIFLPRFINDATSDTASFAFPASLVVASAVLLVVIVGLLGAAVCRRLHDSDRRGTWGLVPLPFLTVGLLGMRWWEIRIGAPEELEGSDLVWFALLFVNNLAYLGGLGLLVWKLIAEGTRGPNRFGPPANDPDAGGDWA